MISNINGNGTSCKYATKISNSKDQTSVQEVNSTGKSDKTDSKSEKQPHQVNPTVKTDDLVEKKVIMQKSESTPPSTDAQSFLSLIQNSRKVAEEAPPLVTKNERPLVAPLNARADD